LRRARQIHTFASMNRIAFLGWILLLQGAARAAEQAAQPSVAATATQTATRWKEKIVDFIMANGPSLMGALAVMVGGWILAGIVHRLVDRTLQKRQLEPPICMLISRIAHLVVLCFALVIALDTAGFKMTTLIAGISVAGVGIGLAMQGVLGNLVSGLLIIFTKPFRVGEYIDIIGEYGQVASIELIATVLTHPDRSRIIIPNRKIVGEVLHNYGTVRQLDLSVGVAYNTDLPRALETIREVLRGNSRIVKDLTPGLGVAGLGDSAINIAVKPWVAVGEFGAAQAELYQSIVEAFRQRGIEMPFPQREIRVLNVQESAQRLTA
jgi:small conductance mechanosensitive channel